MSGVNGYKDIGRQGYDKTFIFPKIKNILNNILKNGGKNYV